MCINYIVLSILFVSNSRSFILDPAYKRTVEINITSNLISQFTDHNVIFHYENATKFKVDSIISKAGIQGSIMMQNYEMPYIITRPTGYKFIHVIMLRNYTMFSQYTNTSILSLENVDVLLFVTDLYTDNKTKTDFKRWDPARPMHSNLTGALFIFNTWDYNLFSVCFFCGRLAKNLTRVTQLSTNSSENYNINVSLVDIYRNQFKDFKSHTFKIGYALYKPFFWCIILESDNDTILFDMQGSEGELLVLLHQQLNMEFHFYNFSEYENTWLTLINSVRNGSIHWGIGGVTVTIERSSVVDFTNYIHTEPFTVLYSIFDDPWMSWTNLVMPFDFEVWITIFFSVLIISCLFYVSVNETNTNSQISFYYFVQGCLRFLVEQPVPYIKMAMKSRWTTVWIMSLWIIVALILTNAYKSKLTSSIISSRADEYNGIDDLVERDYHFFMSDEDSSVIQENLRSSADPKFLETLKRAKNDTDFCTSIQQTEGHKLAVIDEETNLQIAVTDKCRTKMSITSQSALRLIRDELFPSTHAWPMQLNSPYRSAINSVISKVHAAGIFSKWQSQYASTAQMIHKSNQYKSSGLRGSGEKYFTLVNMIGPGIIWCLGMAAAVVSFVGEVAKKGLPKKEKKMVKKKPKKMPSTLEKKAENLKIKQTT